MRTLLENITFVKGVEYLIVVAFGLAFVSLWMLAHRHSKEIKKIIFLIITLSVISGGGAIAIAKYFDPDINNIPNNNTVGIISDQIIVTDNSQNKIPSMITSDYLTVNYGLATEFHKIMSDKVSCSTCHHNSKEVKPCKDCHNKPSNSNLTNTGLLKPGLKAAYHQLCVSCHKEKFNGPNSCTNCHTGKSLEISAPKLHSLTWENCNRCHIDNKDSKIVYHDNCVSCHTKGSGGAPKIPPDRTGYEGNTCQGCHK